MLNNLKKQLEQSREKDMKEIYDSVILLNKGVISEYKFGLFVKGKLKEQQLALLEEVKKWAEEREIDDNNIDRIEGYQVALEDLIKEIEA